MTYSITLGFLTEISFQSSRLIVTCICSALSVLLIFLRGGGGARKTLGWCTPPSTPPRKSTFGINSVYFNREDVWRTKQVIETLNTLYFYNNDLTEVKSRKMHL